MAGDLGTPGNPHPIIIEGSAEQGGVRYDNFVKYYLIRSPEYRKADERADQVMLRDFFSKYREAHAGTDPPADLIQAEMSRLTPEGNPRVARKANANSKIYEVPANGYNSSRVEGVNFETAYTAQTFREQYFLGYDESAIGKFHGHNGPMGGSFRQTSGISFEDQITAREAAGNEPEDVIQFLDYLSRVNGLKVMYAGKKMPGLHPGFIKPMFGTDDLVTTRADYAGSPAMEPANRFDTIIRRLPRATEQVPINNRADGLDNEWPPGTFVNGSLNPVLSPYAGQWVAISYFKTKTFLDLREALIKWTSKARSEYGKGKFLDTARGGWTTREAIEANLKKVLNSHGKTLRPPKSPEPDFEALFKLRLENAQALLITAMPDMMQVNGVRPILRKAEDLSRKKNGTSRSDYPDKKLLNKITPECLNLYDGEPQALVDLLANPGGVEAFLCATPAELAYLQPRLQFYIDGRPVEFPDHTDGHLIQDLAKAKASNAQSVKDIFRSRGTVGTDVGIKNFSWRYENKHSGDSTLKASLTLYFGSSMELLNDEYLRFIFHSGGGTTRPPTASAGAATGEGLTVKDLEKITGQIASRLSVLQNPKSDFFSPESPHAADLVESEAKGHRRPNSPPALTLKAGWAVPAGVEGELTAAFLSGVKRSQRLINLRMYQYQVEFGEQGQLHLTLDYIGGVDEFLGQPDKSNIFDSGVNLGELHSRQVYVNTGVRYIRFDDGSGKSTSIAGLPRLSRLSWPQGYISRRLQDANNIFTDGTDQVQRVGVSLGGVSYEIKTLKLMKEELIARGIKAGDDAALRSIEGWIEVASSVAAEIRISQSDLIYSGFISKLLSSGKLYYATVNTDTINGLGPSFPGKQSVGPGQERGKISFGGDYKYTSGIPYGWRVDVRGGQPASIAGARIAEDRFRSAVNHTSASGGDTAGAAYLDPTGDSFCPEPGVDDKSTALYYMKLGDILDLVLCGIKDRPYSPDIEYILGSFYPHLYRIPGTKPSDIYSLKDIPISMDYFGDWFMRSFLTKQTTPRVSFQRFMKELMTGLVSNLFNRVLRSSDNNNLGRMVFDSSSITSPIKIPSASTRSPTLGRLVGTADLKNLVSRQGDERWSSLGQREYFLMYIKQLNPSLVGNRQKDLDRGIYHLTLGSDRGLVKKFNFSQLDIPFYKEMMIEQGNFAQGVFLAQNVDITMVGNNLFRNGQTIFVNADFGLGAAAKKLGIGGYYTITRVDNYIESGKFETKIKCNFVKPKVG